MKKLAMILAVAMLASCAQSKEGSEQTQAPKSSQEKVVDKTENTKTAADPSYSVFNNMTFDEFKKVFQEKYELVYKSMSNDGKVSKTPLGEIQENEMLYDIRLSPYLVLSCIENDDGTLGMAVVVKLTPAQDPSFDAVMVNKQFAILKQTLIAATAPGATSDDIKAVNDGLPKAPKSKEEEPSFSYKGITYMDNLDTEDPAVAKESFMITYE